MVMGLIIAFEPYGMNSPNRQISDLSGNTTITGRFWSAWRVHTKDRLKLIREICSIEIGDLDLLFKNDTVDLDDMPTAAEQTSKILLNLEVY